MWDENCLVDVGPFKISKDLLDGTEVDHDFPFAIRVALKYAAVNVSPYLFLFIACQCSLFLLLSVMSHPTFQCESSDGVVGSGNIYEYNLGSYAKSYFVVAVNT